MEPNSVGAKDVAVVLSSYITPLSIYAPYPRPHKEPHKGTPQPNSILYNTLTTPPPMINKQKITAITTIMAITILVTTTMTSEAEAYTVDPALIQTVQNYAAETHYGTDHVDRWKRVLDAFGVIQHTSSMTAAQAQQMADTYSANRWNPIVAALTALEQSQQQQDTTAPVITLNGASQVTLTVGDTYVDAGATCTDDTDGAISTLDDSANVDTQTPNSYTITYSCTDTSGNIAAPVYRTVTVEEPPTQTSYTVDPTLIQTVQNYAAETHHGADHVDRWKRVLDAFGVITHTSSMTAAQAQQMADTYSANRWNPIVAALTALEQSQQQQQQDQPPVVYQQDQLSPSAEWAIVKAEAVDIDLAVFKLTTTVYDEHIHRVHSTLWPQVELLERKYVTSDNSLRALVSAGDNLYPDELPAHIIKTRTAIEWVKTEIIAEIEKIINPYGDVTSCPPDLQDNRANRNFLDERIFVPTGITVLPHGTTLSSPLILPDGTILPAGTTFSPNDIITLGTGVALSHGNTLPDGTILPAGTTLPDGTSLTVRTAINNGFKNTLEDRLCAYHDIDYYGSSHNNLIKQAMLALGIHPEADNITPMSADMAYDMSMKYDNSRNNLQGDFMHPFWQEHIWKEISSNILQSETEKYFEDNRQSTEQSHMTYQQICESPLVHCEYSTSSRSVNDGQRVSHELTETWVSKVTSYKSIDSILDNSDSTLDDDIGKTMVYDNQGNIAEIKYYMDGKLVQHRHYTDNVLTASTTYNTTTGFKALEITYDTNGDIRWLAAWHPDTTDGHHDKQLVGIVKRNGEVSSASVWYPGTNDIALSLGIKFNCYDIDGRTKVTCTDEHYAYLELDQYLYPIKYMSQETWYNQYGSIKELKQYDKGVLMQHNKYGEDTGGNSYLAESKAYHTNGVLGYHTQYNAEQITYYREYYKSGNLFASSNNFNSDNTVINGRTYHDTSDTTAYEWIHQSSFGNFSCKPQISRALAVDCTPDEISYFKRTFDKLR